MTILKYPDVLKSSLCSYIFELITLATMKARDNSIKHVGFNLALNIARTFCNSTYELK